MMDIQIIFVVVHVYLPFTKFYNHKLQLNKTSCLTIVINAINSLIVISLLTKSH